MSIDTQGMSISKKGGGVEPDRVYPPFKPKVLTIFNEQERKELKEIFREVLNESTG
jgi:hypothetical protein